MAKRNLNEVLGFISRWGDSDFSLRLLDEALTSAALEKAAIMAEKDKPTSIRARQLRSRGIKRLADEKKLEAIIKDKSPQNQQKREKALRIRSKMTSFEDTEFDPKLEGQVTGKGSGKPVIVGGKKQILKNPELEQEKPQPIQPRQPKPPQEKPQPIQPRQPKPRQEKPQPIQPRQPKPRQKKPQPTQSGKQKKILNSDLIDIVHAGTRSFGDILGATRALGGLLSAPAGTSGGDISNISSVVSGITGPIRNIQGLFGVNGIPNRRFLDRYYRGKMNRSDFEYLKRTLKIK